MDTKAPFIGTQMFLNPQLFLSAYGFRRSTRYPMNSATHPDIFEPALQSGKNKIRNKFDKVWTVNPDIFEFDDVAVSCRLPNNKPIWWQCVGLGSL